MLRHMGFSCWISSDGAPSQTYSVESVGNVKTAWIASTADKTFAVHWQDHSGKRIAASGHVFIDGKDVASAIIRPGRETPVKRTGAKMGRNVIKPFVFSELSLTDDDDVASPYDMSLRHVGTIRIEISRVRLGAEVPFAKYEEAQDHGVVHERAKKAGAHCTRFGDAKRIANARTVSISTAPYDRNEPEMLKAVGIIQTGRKRSKPITENDEVIEIESSDDETPSSTLHPSSPRTTSPDSPSRKRVKTEPQSDDLSSFTQSSPPRDMSRTQEPQSSFVSSLPQSSPPLATNNDGREPTASLGFSMTQSQTQPDDSQASERLPSPTPNQPPNALSDAVKDEEHDEEEELDMLAGDSEGTQSQDVNLPPPPSSSGPGVLSDRKTRGGRRIGTLGN